jgi:hypothetical protein
VNTENYRKNIWYDPKHSAGVSGPEKLFSSCSSRNNHWPF